MDSHASRDNRAYRQHVGESMECIARLSAITLVPSEPTIYKKAQQLRGSRQLLPEDERQIASGFAYIAACKDDSTKIMAACVEERSDPNAGLIIRVASNSGVSEQVIDNLSSVADIMIAAANAGTLRSLDKLNDQRPDLRRSEIESRDFMQDMLDRIVGLCTRRILSRLRSKHVRRKYPPRVKPCLLPQVLSAVKRSESLPVTKLSAEENKTTLGQLRRLARLSESIEASQPGEYRHSCLVDLVSGICQLNLEVIRRLLVPELDVGLKQHILNALPKLARYARISRYLIKAALGPLNVLCRSVQIVAIQHPSFVPQRSPLDTDTHNRLFAETADKNAKLLTRRVHAEIQILMYYEMHKQALLPSIICSSKLACYCCDLFVRCHGRFTVPGSHGKIYDTWALPDPSTLDARVATAVIPTIERFNAQLRQTISSLAGRRMGQRPPPNESVASTVLSIPSTSTVKADSKVDLRLYNKTMLEAQALIPTQSAKAEDITFCDESARESGYQSVRSGHSRGSVETLTTVSMSPKIPDERSVDESKGTIQTTCPPQARTINGRNLRSEVIVEDVATCFETASLEIFAIVDSASVSLPAAGPKERDGAVSVVMETIGISADDFDDSWGAHTLVNVREMEVSKDYTFPIGTAIHPRLLLLESGNERISVSFRLSK